MVNDCPSAARRGEPGARRWIERRVAGCSRTVAQRNRIAERAHQGIRRTDGENRQGSIPGSVLAPAGEGCGNTDRADVCPDDRGSVSVPEKSRGRLFSRVKTWPKRLRREQTAERYQQSRRPVSANDDGAGSALYSGAFWSRQ